MRILIESYKPSNFEVQSAFKARQIGRKNDDWNSLIWNLQNGEMNAPFNRSGT